MFLSEYGVSRIPTPASLENILASVAKTELIAKPSISLSEIKIGMFAGRFKETAAKKTWMISSKK